MSTPLQLLFGPLLDHPELRALAAEMRRGQRVAVLSGMTGGAKALVLVALQKLAARPLVLVASDAAAIEHLRRDIEFYFQVLHGVESAEDHVVTIPASEADPYDGTSPHAEILEERAIGLMRLARATVPITITTARGALKRTIHPDELLDLAVELVIDSDYALERVVETLVAAGYSRQEPVAAVGDFSVRGGILDVFPPGSDNPVRVEFFGDTVDSIRAFDPETQRSTGRLRSILAPPMREQPDRRKTMLRWADTAPEHFNEPRFNADLRAKLAAAEHGESFSGWEYLTPLVEPLEASLFDYLGDAVVAIDEPADLERLAARFLGKIGARYAEAFENGEVALPPEKLFLTDAEFRARVEGFARLDLRVLGKAAARVDAEFAIDGSDNPLFYFPLPADATEVRIASQSPLRYHGRIRELAGDLAKSASPGTARLLVMPSPGVAERVVQMLAEYEVPASLVARLDTGGERQAAGMPAVAVGRLSTGLRLTDPDVTVLVESDLFAPADLQTEQRKPARRKRSQASAFLSDFRDLRPGDYVVHIDHGIGRFQGLVQMPVGDGRDGVREFMLLTYSGDSKLYVPVERLDLVQKYSASEGHAPQVDRLGGLSWAKTKAKTSRAMRDMAEELLKLYAERKLVPGHAFGSDGPWQREFEDAFEYQLTEDQDTAIADIKGDLENQTPMDRLLCGDVGYGKTEVAMRAMFKVLMEGKQVAVLAPTTVLVFQHYKTLLQRFAAFPIAIDMLSRFRSAKEQKVTIEAISSGMADIVVGTHRILSKDVQFKDLGLVVVDEEQRFGVAHKERLKHLRKRVDVLTMSATPIPRTLNMSLAGIRDMSVIETPPRDRLAIQTSVVPFSEHVIRSAIEQELARGGQIFFVHNRVETIFTIAELIARIVPSARLGVGHGQMGEKLLEDVMMRFVSHETDILVSTTIIENGIDIPLANTIIINRADTFGLAQLYQLRGRVGRSNRQAYAYLLIPSEAELTPIARKRLAAIREFADLGAGFRIAALDLELRGAGNLLGGQQSGFINAVGFDLYCQMLERTVRELRGDRIEDEEATASIDLRIDVRIPEDYIGDVNQRLRTYKRISTAQSDRALEEIHAELADRYGPLPLAVDNLFGYARVRNLATRLGIASVDLDRSRLSLKIDERMRIPPEKLLAFVADPRRGATFTSAGIVKIPVSGKLANEHEAIAFVEAHLRDLENPV